jgi:flagellar basal body rod protein FlgB
MHDPLNSAPSANSHAQPSGETTHLIELLLQQQQLNRSQAELYEQLSQQQYQLQTLNLLYQQLSPDIAQHQPPDYSPIQQQYEALLKKIQATDEHIHQTLKQHKTTDENIHKTLQLIERKETSIESAVHEQRDEIRNHLQSMSLKLLILGIVAIVFGPLVAWLMPGGLWALHTKQQTLEANQQKANSTLFLIWRDQQTTHKFLGVPQKK